MEKLNPIVITNDETGEEYTLEYNRSAVVLLERDGFIEDDVSTNTMERIPQLFHFAFKMHHPNITREQTDSILFDQLGGLDEEMIIRLCGLYATAVKTLIREDKNPKNSKMRIRM